MVLLKTLIEPYSFAGNRNVKNNWNIASMNLAAADFLGQRGGGLFGTSSAEEILERALLANVSCFVCFVCIRRYV